MIVAGTCRGTPCGCPNGQERIGRPQGVAPTSKS